MISGENIIYFGPDKWNGMWRNRHHLMSQFSIANKVLYVEPVSNLKQIRAQLKNTPFSWFHFLRNIGAVRTTKIKEQLSIYHSAESLPITRRYPFEMLTWQIWCANFKRSLTSLGIRRPILWISKPYMHHLCGRLDEKMTIYHVVDEYLAYTDVTPERRLKGSVAEKKMLRKADLVIVVSKSLFQSKSVFNKQTHMVPNAVDYHAYEAITKRKGVEPADIASIPRPIAGYSGLISNRLNIELMIKLAQENAGLSLALIGKIDRAGCENGIAELLQLPNVFYLGLKKIVDVPRYVHAFDVCILPYRENDETKNLSALKLYDYMATGKPIVTSRFPEAFSYREIISICGSKQEFIDRINDALEDDGNLLGAKRKQVAAANTWDARAEQISGLIEEVLC